MRKINEKTGQLTDDGYQFEVSKDPAVNQRRYEALGEVITDQVYDLLVENGLHKIHVPSDLPEREATFVFTSKPDFSDTRKLLVLIHGSGVVRAGQWSRSLIINHSLDHGTQIPYIRRAKELGYEVLITNTNDNYCLVDGRRRSIPGHDSPQTHATSVWEQFIKPAEKLESVAIVAHSYGGPVTMDLAQKFPAFFEKNVFAVGLTDSVHSSRSVPKELIQHLQKVTSERLPRKIK